MSVAQPTLKAKYATVYDEAVTLVKAQDRLYVVYEDRIAPFEVEMAPFTVVLGDCALADTQALLDRAHGGCAAICTSRPMLEV